MSKKEKQIGICCLCKEEKELTFEHIPPKTAFNKNTRYYSIPDKEFFKIKDFLNYKHMGLIKQGGMGGYYLCRECNSFLGSNYVRSYQGWANMGMGIVQSPYTDADLFSVRIKNSNPLRILKQIIAIFICLNNNDFTNTKGFFELLDFVRNPNSNYLPNRYKIYTYLNNEGNFRKVPHAYTNFAGLVGEFTYPPFGYILSIDEPHPVSRLTDITHFKDFQDNRLHEFEIALFKNPTYYPIILDYRRKEEFEVIIAEVENDNKNILF